ncbi:serine-rich adhesin for platelets-like isoform X2 [Chironomus tepperi]|uniref:serine-rich adhesin for platelets-like isoform X2 n=1 Tax=Chironomus tepperi TaxID=113505 RepID=UPI00391F9BFF
MDQTKIIIESLLTGSQFEISISEHDKISIVKSNIQKILGIPSNQLHLLHNQMELNDSMLLKDIPNFHEGNKLKLKLVLGMKVGPISSARRVPLTDYDSWFDDVMHQNSKREEPLTIKTKYLVYKGCKKNVHRLWKMNGSDSKGKSTSGHNNKYGKSTNSLFGGGLSGRDDDKIKKMTDQTIQENIRTTEKVNQLRLKMELVNARKKLKSIKFPLKSKNNSKMMDISMDKLSKQITDNITKELNVIEKPLTVSSSSSSLSTAATIISSSSIRAKDNLADKVIQKQSSRNLSAESKMKIKENLSRNRSFKTILNQPTISASTSSMSLFNNDINPLEFCFSSTGTNGSDIFAPTTNGNKLGRSLSFQSNYILNRTDSNLCVNTSSLATMEAATISNSSPIIQEYMEHICEPSSASSTAIGTKMKDQLPKTNYSTSMQDLLLQEFLTKSTPNSACSHFQLATPKSGREYPSANNSGSALKLAADEKIDMFKGTAITKVSPGDEYFILPKLLIREDSPPILESLVVKDSKAEDLLDVASGKQPSAESLIEFYENLTSSSTSSLTSKINDYECFHQPPSTNRFYHSDLDLNQLNDRFKNNLSISNQNINTSEGNLGSDSDWPRSNLLLLSINQTMKDEPQSDYNLIDVNYDKFINDLLNNDSGVSAVLGSDNVDSDSVNNKKECESNDIVENIKKSAFSDGSKLVSKDNSEMIDLFGGDLDNVLTKKMTSRRITPLKKPIDKLKSFSSNPQLGNHNTLSTHESSNLATTTSTTTVHIPQLSRLDAIPTKYRRGYINLNDACLSNSDLSTSTSSTTKLPKTCDRKSSLTTKDLSSFHHGASIFHCRSNQNERIPQPPTFDYFDGCATETSSNRKSSDVSNFDFQSEENLFNMNFDSFYEDFVDSAELSWSSSSSSTSFDSSSISSMYDKKYVILPEIKLDNNDLKADDKALMVAKEKVETASNDDNNLHHQHHPPTQHQQPQNSNKESTGKLRCFHCNKKLGIIMVMKCHCNQYFCSAHRYKEVHNCSYDYKENGRKQLERENPLVCTQKLPKI